ncbi:MAG: methyltransferase domain-containing protein [Mucilaginibacter sp.]|uniref:methyltransferase domain-containing protein n=1 Tax=Mucilaginibacter sp. TaxID=1882438 RepID=UPI003562810F
METSILYYIKDPIPFVMLGGMSGVGKTTLIDELISAYPDFFAQPISFTSRAKRNDYDRYIFIDAGSLISMYNIGELLNLDYVHNNYYGISKNGIVEIIEKGMIPIKEIHPENFHKFSTIGINSIRILIQNRHLTQESSPFLLRSGRNKDDFDFEGFSDYDIAININNLSPCDAAIYLIKRVLAYKIHLSTYPHPSEIDCINRIGYSKIASEFHDELRITTKNFHDASLNFWHRHLEKIAKFGKEKNVLELGPGNGWLFNSIGILPDNIFFAEIAPEMNACSDKKVFISNARNIPTSASYFDLVVGSLIDPLLNAEVFIEVERILKPGGEFIFTVPSSDWANNLNDRENKNQTTFTLLSGEKVNVFSFCNALSIHLSIAAFSDLKIEEVSELRLEKCYEQNISKAIFDSARNAGKTIYELPIVLGIKMKKKI